MFFLNKKILTTKKNISIGICEELTDFNILEKNVEIAEKHNTNWVIFVHTVSENKFR